MSSQDNTQTSERLASTTKRISTLNDHEGHILRYKITAYQKIHNKEVAGVSHKLEEIRESMKALASDPLYGTHALDGLSHTNSNSFTKPTRLNASDRSFKLRRTQSFPDLLDDADFDGKRRTLPELKDDIRLKQRATASGEKMHLSNISNNRVGAANKRLEQMAGKPHLGKLANEERLSGHKKLERSKTAPVTMLQPLLKTTPKMMRKKIHTVICQGSDDNNVNGVFPVRFEGVSAQLNARRTNTPVNRPRTYHEPTKLGFSVNPSSVESAKQRFSRHDFMAQGRLSSGKNTNRDLESSSPLGGKKSRNRGVPHSIDTGGHHDSFSGLKNCRYLRFPNDSQENNRI